jgi:elongin-A
MPTRYTNHLHPDTCIYQHLQHNTPGTFQPHTHPEFPSNVLNSEIWRDLCHHKYPLAVERYSKSYPDEPKSWKVHFFVGLVFSVANFQHISRIVQVIQEAEAKRLEEATAKLRNQRLEADGRKKEREVKLTDRVPPQKRARMGASCMPIFLILQYDTDLWMTACTGSTNVQPKTLFQKTKTEASKIQRTMYNARIVPPMPPNGRNFRVLAKPDPTLPLSPTSNNTKRVTVNTVMLRRTSTDSAPPTTLSSASSSSQSSPHFPAPAMSKGFPIHSPATIRSANHQVPPHSTTSTISSDASPLKAPSSGKKDPMATLFVPKRRAYSQRVS